MVRLMTKFIFNRYWLIMGFSTYSFGIGFNIGRFGASFELGFIWIALEW